MDPAATAFSRPYVVSWNLTYRCNLACEHCYLDAGGKPLVDDPAFSDRSELTTEQCFKVADDIAAFAPEAVTILTGGEPLLRRDILPIVRHADGRGLWVVVGTNGVKVTPTLAALLARGEELQAAVGVAPMVAAWAVEHGLHELGAGDGPVDIFNLKGAR